MALTCKGVFIVGAKRTPFCSYGGPLREMPASHAFAAAAKAAILSANVNPENIDNTVVGNAHFLSQCDGGKTPRYCGIYSGVPISKPALGVSKACGTGLQSLVSGAVDILTGSAKISLTGGTEIMSSLPFLVSGTRFGTALGASYQMEDHIRKLNIDSHTGLTLQRMAEDIAKKYQISRGEADEFAVQSNLKWKTANEAKAFEEELANVTVTIKKKEVVIDRDENSQSKSLEELSGLPSLLDDGSIITLGNSANPADGAAAILLASEEVVKQNNLKPLVRVTGWACVGVDPLETGLGAAAAVKSLLALLNRNVDDVDLYEINETFASQALATIRELKLDPSKVNVSGGVLAMGHPIAATGTRMAGHLAHKISKTNSKIAVAASSCGGGQGIAVMLEQV